MKKNYFMLAAATMMFAACAETDLVNEVNMEEAPKAIGFDAFANKTTRAAIENADDLASTTEGQFTVWGWKTFVTDDETTTKVPVFVAKQVNWNATDGWHYSPIQYWDKNASSYDFYAVAPKAGNATYSITNEKKIKIENVASGDGETATDYLIDRDGATNVSVGSTVQFNFSHIMSKITVQVKHSITPGTNVDVVLTDLAMDGWDQNTGTFTQDKYVPVLDENDDVKTDADGNEITELQEWELAETEGSKGSYEFLKAATNDDKELSATAQEVGSYLMVPQKDVDLNFTISYMIGAETFLEHTGTIENQTWETNTHYTYTIIVGPADIKFNVSAVEGWATGDTGNGTTIQ